MAVLLGILSAFFFSFTFLMNQLMADAGGSWMWSASLRFLFMLPLLFILMLILKLSIKDTLKAIKKQPLQWLLWSQVGFGLFYAPLCFGTASVPSWLAAGSWQLTIVAGVLLSPLFKEKVVKNGEMQMISPGIPKKSLLWSLVIFAGVLLMESDTFVPGNYKTALIGILAILVAAFAYPLGNRKLMAATNNEVSTIQRVFGMTLCSLPTWIILSIFALVTVGPPSKGQLMNASIVALFSGVLGTVLFFEATKLVHQNLKKLAAVEATQAGEVVFSLLLSLLFLHTAMPRFIAWIGLALIIFGMIGNSLTANQKQEEIEEELPF